MPACHRKRTEAQRDQPACSIYLKVIATGWGLGSGPLIRRGVLSLHSTHCLQVEEHGSQPGSHTPPCLPKGGAFAQHLKNQVRAGQVNRD